MPSNHPQLASEFERACQDARQRGVELPRVAVFLQDVPEAQRAAIAGALEQIRRSVAESTCVLSDPLDRERSPYDTSGPGGSETVILPEGPPAPRSVSAPIHCNDDSKLSHSSLNTGDPQTGSVTKGGVAEHTIILPEPSERSSCDVTLDPAADDCLDATIDPADSGGREFSQRTDPLQQ